MIGPCEGISDISRGCWPHLRKSSLALPFPLADVPWTAKDCAGSRENYYLLYSKMLELTHIGLGDRIIALLGRTSLSPRSGYPFVISIMSDYERCRTPTAIQVER